MISLSDCIQPVKKYLVLSTLLASSMLVLPNELQAKVTKPLNSQLKLPLSKTKNRSKIKPLNKALNYESVKHVVIIYLENHSFFNLFANFPGADNKIPDDYLGEVNELGELYKTLPPIAERKAKVPDSRFPINLLNKPFLIDTFVKQNELIPDPNHEFYSHQAQINEGKNNKFVLNSKVGALPLGYYDLSNSYLWKVAKEYVLSDQFYQSAYGGSFLNHQWLIAAQTPLYPNAPNDLKMILDNKGIPEKTKPLTSDGFVVNTIQPYHPPFNGESNEIEKRLPPLDYSTIGDRLTEKNISWAWYAGGWTSILEGKNPGNFQYHHQPFLYFKNYGPGTTNRQNHLKDETELIDAIKDDHLPSVSFYKPVGNENIHPGYADLTTGISKVETVIELLKKNKSWEKTLVIITFDEYGGFWDPKPPKKIDRWGLGTRIPTIFVSPLVKKNFVDHTQYETVSILSFLEKKYSLKPLTDRDQKANPLTGIWMN